LFEIAERCNLTASDIYNYSNGLVLTRYIDISTYKCIWVKHVANS